MPELAMILQHPVVREIKKDPKVRQAFQLVHSRYKQRLSEALGKRDVKDFEGKIHSRAAELVQKKIEHNVNVFFAMIRFAPEHLRISGIVTALLHDIERSTQALMGSFSDTKTGFDHAQKGARYVELNRHLLASIDWEDFVLIVEAVAEHSKVDPKKGSELIPLIRDVDRYVILHEVMNNLHGDLDPVPGDDNTIGEKAMAAFRSKKLMKGKDVRPESRLDCLVYRLCWIFDIQNVLAKRALIEEGVVDQFISRIVEFSSPADQQNVQEVIRLVEEWKREVMRPS